MTRRLSLLPFCRPRFASLGVAQVTPAPSAAPRRVGPQAPAPARRPAGPGRPGPGPGGRRRHREHPLERRTTPRRCASWGSTPPRPATSSTTCPTRRTSGPRRAASRSGPSRAATEVQILRSSTLDPYGRTLGYLFVNGRNYSVLVVAGSPRRRDRQPLRRQRAAQGGGRGAGRREGRRTRAVRAALPVPGSHARGLGVDAAEGHRGREVGAGLKTPPRRLLLPLAIAAAALVLWDTLRRLPVPDLRRVPARDLARARRGPDGRLHRVDRPQLRRGRRVPNPGRLAVPDPERGLPRQPVLGRDVPGPGRAPHPGPHGDRAGRRPSRSW